MSEEQRVQAVADRVNLGPHQHLIELTDEEGRPAKFVVHRPTINEEIRVGVLYAMLRTPSGGATGPAEIDVTRDMFAFYVATLNVVVDFRPEWCPKDLGESRDTLLIQELYAAYEAWLDNFRRRLSGDGGEDRGASEPAA